MIARLLSVSSAVALVVSASAALAAPRGSAQMRSTYRPPAHVTHVMRFDPVALQTHPFVPAYVPFYGAPWQAGLGAASFLNMSPLACRSAFPQTLGDLGSGGAGATFAPVALAATPLMNVLPTGSTALAQQSYCQQPTLDLSNLNLTGE